MSSIQRFLTRRGDRRRQDKDEVLLTVPMKSHRPTGPRILEEYIVKAIHFLQNPHSHSLPKIRGFFESHGPSQEGSGQDQERLKKVCIAPYYSLTLSVY